MGAEPAGEPVGALFEEKGRGAGGEGGGVHGEECGDPGRYFGGVEGGRGVCTAGSQESGRPLEVHGGGCTVSGGGDGDWRSGAKAWGRGAGDSADGWGGEGSDREGEWREFGGRENRREFGLCDLYVGIDREAKRSGDRAPAVGELREGCGGGRGIEGGAVCAGIDAGGGFGEHDDLSGPGEWGESAHHQ